LLVSVDDLRTAGTHIEASADAAARDVDEFDGQQAVRSGEASAFETMTAAGSCEQGWQQAVRVISVKLAVAADRPSRNAAAYVATEQQNAQRFTK
jgi:hypothetical protein